MACLQRSLATLSFQRSIGCIRTAHTTVVTSRHGLQTTSKNRFNLLCSRAVCSSSYSLRAKDTGRINTESQPSTGDQNDAVTSPPLCSERRDELVRLHMKYQFEGSGSEAEPIEDANTTVYRKLSYPDYTPGPHAQNISNVRKQYDSSESLGPGEHLKDCMVEITGRITSVRKASRKLVFYDVSAEGVTLQVVASAARFSTGNASNESSMYEYNVNMLRVGDIVGAEGHIGRTKMGELSVFASCLKMLSPCLHGIPERLLDTGIQRSHRHLHMLVNKDFVQTLHKRTKVIQTVRDFFVSKRFLEVETPVLWPSAGGASARPFVTHAHGIDADLSLRIATELFLKTLVIGGIDRVYRDRHLFEIGKQFRNEGIDATHNPEFTTCEAYMAYGDFDVLCTMTEDLVRRVVVTVTGGTLLPVPHSTSRHHDAIAASDRTTNAEDALHEIDFEAPFARVWVMDALEAVLGRQLPCPVELASCGAVGEASLNALKQICIDVGVAVTPPVTTAALLDRLVSKFIEPTLVQPTFLCGHPLCMSPLAKEDPRRPGLVLEICRASDL